MKYEFEIRGEFDTVTAVAHVAYRAVIDAVEDSISRIDGRITSQQLAMNGKLQKKKVSERVYIDWEVASADFYGNTIEIALRRISDD